MATINLGGCCCPEQSGSGSGGSGSGDVVGDGCTTCWNCCRYLFTDEMYFQIDAIGCTSVDPCGDFPCSLSTGYEVVYLFGEPNDPLCPPSSGYHFTRNGIDPDQQIFCCLGDNTTDGFVYLTIIPPGWTFPLFLTYRMPLEDWRCEGPNTFFLFDIPAAVAACNDYSPTLTVLKRP